MSSIDRLVAELEGARAALLASVAGTPQDVFEADVIEDDTGYGTSIRDLLWHVGLFEDWTRRTIDVALRGDTPGAYVPRPRPGIAQTPEYLGEWLAQCRRPLLALLRRLPEDALDASFTLPDGQSVTAKGMLEQVTARDRKHAERIRSMRGCAAGPPEGAGCGNTQTA